MPKISEEKKKKIKEMILALLYEKSPRPLFTSHIAKEIARDEEFIKKLMHELLKENFVTKIEKNKRGYNYLRRERWRLTKKVYSAYRKLSKKSSEVM